MKRHIASLDGVRGAAIIAVILYHAGRGLTYVGSHEQIVQQLVGIGWIGVDLFFVLSGFLITGILLDARGSEGYFRVFYGRRALRIFPLYFAFVAAVMWIAPMLGLVGSEDAARLHASQPWYWTYTVNALVTRGGWAMTPWHTGHLWSLSVEEQFYLLWPAVVLVAGRRRLISISLAIVAGVALLRAAIVATTGPSLGVYVLLPTRMDELALGAALAGLARDPQSWRFVARLTAPVAALSAGVLLFMVRGQLLMPTNGPSEAVGYIALAWLAGALLVSALNVKALSVVWESAPLRFLGRYSYGLYMWHQLTITELQHFLPASRLPVVGGSHLPGNALFIVIAFGTSIAAALVSWHLIEYPFLKLKVLLPYQKATKPSAYAAEVPAEMKGFSQALPE
jgi:peptidoglycan/LPS O-acetylase OafA/YrhL